MSGVEMSLTGSKTEDKRAMRLSQREKQRPDYIEP